MTLTLHFHPLSSFCWKALVGLYELGIPFEKHLVDLSDEEARAAFVRLWPLGKFPVLRDEARGRTIPESTIILEYIDRLRPGAPRLLPSDPDRALECRLRDRLLDAYLHLPMQKIVGDKLRPAARRDPLGVEQARAQMETAYALTDEHLRDGPWAMGADFTIVDCAALPARCSMGQTGSRPSWGAGPTSRPTSSGSRGGLPWRACWRRRSRTCRCSPVEGIALPVMEQSPVLAGRVRQTKWERTSSGTTTPPVCRFHHTRRFTPRPVHTPVPVSLHSAPRLSIVLSMLSSTRRPPPRRLMVMALGALGSAACAAAAREAEGARAGAAPLPVAEAPARPAVPPGAPGPGRGGPASSSRRGLRGCCAGSLSEEVMRADGKFSGWRLVGLPEEWKDIDIKPGDVVTRVNGLPIETPDQAYDAWKSVASAPELKISLMRDGAARQLVLPIDGVLSPETSRALGQNAGPQRAAGPAERRSKPIGGSLEPGDEEVY